ncbi:hypothetical protein [Edaphosphingomonas haloaromaticamans]|uniref:hypothetical protein n=1 Tax=Edaphosphingomonas haloaromaticamans TaxID=653954 RepID=UPI0011139A21|nr:hypothetical protein [Sphingomonas haloaromaticamans]
MRFVILSLALAFAAPAYAESDLERGFSGALKGCETWVLDPTSWASGPEPFIKAVGLGAKMGLVESVEAVNLPPTQLRQANHFWRINSTEGAGYILVVSDQLPMCHITGGGNADLQPAIEAVLASPAFRSRWEQQSNSIKDGMASTTFRNREEPAMTIQISRAVQPKQRLDRVQLIATATFKTK